MDSWKDDEASSEAAKQAYTDILRVVGEVESGYQRDAFERTMESRVKKFNKQQIAALMPDGTTGREIGKAQDKMDDMVEEVMSEFDKVVDRIEGLLGTSSNTELPKKEAVSAVTTSMAALQGGGTGSVQSQLQAMQNGVEEIRGISMSLGRDKTRFVKEVGEVGVALKEGITKILRMVEHQKDTLNGRTNKWKAKADKATRQQYSALRKAISLSKKGYRKLEKSIKKEHKTDLKMAKKAVSRVFGRRPNGSNEKRRACEKSSKHFRRPSKGSRGKWRRIKNVLRIWQRGQISRLTNRVRRWSLGMNQSTRLKMKFWG